MLAIINQLDLELHQIEVKTTVLNGDLEDEIYLRQREGFKSKSKWNMNYKLQKNLYGLKQSSHCWNKTINEFLKELEYQWKTMLISVSILNYS